MLAPDDKKKTLLLFLQGYALLLILGGIFFHEHHSWGAIIPSVLSGLFIQIGLWLLWRKKKYAFLFNFTAVLGLTLFFIYRWLLIQKFYPPGILTLVSLFLAFKLYQTCKHLKKATT